MNEFSEHWKASIPDELHNYATSCVKPFKENFTDICRIKNYDDYDDYACEIDLSSVNFGAQDGLMLLSNCYVSPHTDNPERTNAKKWTIFYVVESNGHRLYDADKKENTVKTGDMILLNVHEIHSMSLPEKCFEKPDDMTIADYAIKMLEENNFVAIMLESDCKPDRVQAENMISQHIKEALYEYSAEQSQGFKP